jgi:hypothetical protein
MDSIDIVDPAFTIQMPNISETFVGSNDYTMYIYIGAAILIAIIGMFIHKFYVNKQTRENNEDCEGGFCTMNAPL